MSRNTLLVILALVVPGCCWTAKRSCFPPCPPPTVVKVERPCELPPALELPLVERSPCGEPGLVACYDAANAGNVARRETSMKDWIREARARCEGAN